jgi:hypothetical protein
MNGKGDGRRPCQVSRSQYDANYEAAFGVWYEWIGEPATNPAVAIHWVHCHNGTKRAYNGLGESLGVVGMVPLQLYKTLSHKPYGIT